DEQILEALKSDAQDIYYEAVCAAGAWGVEGAWSHVAALVTTDHTDKHLLLAAIDAAANIRPLEAPEILADLTDSDDEDIVEATFDALAMAELWSSEWEDHNEQDS
ncbi:MAG: hypothetical protein KAY24_11695, partial [Candidatus Eisenbacteria sp.]|nr:hypothetical protein [Candidatus Eisenbacteria bacterium]